MDDEETVVGVGRTAREASTIPATKAVVRPPVAHHERLDAREGRV
jgi:hypothetical protein